MTAISTHVLDTARGLPPGGMTMLLEVRAEDGTWSPLGEAASDADGRATLPGGPLRRATYRLTFRTAAYFEARRVEAFYPEVQVVFDVHDPSRRHHVPLLLSPWGYSTYRGT